MGCPPNDMDYTSIIERVYGHLENDHVEKAVMACLRLARNTHDYLNATIFLHELNDDKEQTQKVFYDETVKLNDEARKFLWQRALDVWLAGRTLPYSLDSHDDKKNVLCLGAGDLDSQIVQLERSIQDMAIPPGMGEFDTAAFTDRYMSKKSAMRLRINAVQTVRQRIKTRCLNYAIGLEKQLQAQQKTELFLQKVQTEVNNYFKARCEDVYTKLYKASQLVDSNDIEDYSALLGHIRRAMKAVADHFCPPVPQPVVCVDGIERKLGDEQYLNRLQEFLATTFPPASATELLGAELALLVAFARKLNDISSKGVHATVSGEEAKQALLGLYMFLYNVISLLQTKDATKGAAPQTLEP
jgi:hypothetical protein